jgi:hypothetical protein
MCKKLLPISEFWKNKSIKDGYDSRCKNCRKANQNKEKQKERHNNLRKSNTEYLNSLKTPCAKCGENRKYIIQFHHLNPSSKEFDLGHNKTYSKEHLIREVQKCVCLCSNCHDEFHYLYGRNPDDPEKSLVEYLKFNSNCTK